ncbi:Protein GrpE [Linum grandiflorum]
MAMTLSNQTLLSSPSPAISALTFPKTLDSTKPNSLLFSFSSHPKPLKGLFSSFIPAVSVVSKKSSFHGRRRSFLTRCAQQEATSADAETLTNEEEGALDNKEAEVAGKEETDEESGVAEEESEPEAVPENESELKNLFYSYKEAVLSGDKETASEIEAKIDAIDSNNNELMLKVSALSAETSSNRDKYIRLQADFDNFRKRSENDRLNIRSDAQGAVIESLLPMTDSFERAKQSIKPETDKEKQIDKSYQGIYKQFLEIMKGLQVISVPTVGHPFDPEFHEAIAREDSEEYAEGIVVQEFRPGFRLGNRLIRAAMVKVSAGPGPKTQDAPPASVEDQVEQEATTEG